MVNQNKKKLSECTSILAGKKATADGSRIIARSEDWVAKESKNLEIFRDTENGPTEFIAPDSPFRCTLNPHAYGYTALSPCTMHGYWGSAGFNTQGVGMSATETIFSSDKALNCDPLVDAGVGENCIFNIVLPYIKTAKEGVERLGKLIQKHGISEGFGISFIDDKEVWYLETACGHRYLACKLPDKKYFVSGNQSRFRKYKKDDDHYMASDDLIEFAVENNFYNPSEDFDFHKAYSRDVEEDTTYNYPRVWGLQKFFSPSMDNDVKINNFPVYAEPDKKVSISKLREAFRFHYNGTEHDPYLNNNPGEPYRPVSIMRTTQTHILQVRPKLPAAIGEVNYMCMGMAALGVFVPYYQGLDEYIEPYTKGGTECSNDSAYWKFRKVQTLGMTNYNRYAPFIQRVYNDFESKTDDKMRDMEEKYLKCFKKGPSKAKQMLNEFNKNVMQEALDITDKLIEDLFTRMTSDIESVYKFHGA